MEETDDHFWIVSRKITTLKLNQLSASDSWIKFNFQLPIKLNLTGYYL
jgi:hypothetical protein